MQFKCRKMPPCSLDQRRQKYWQKERTRVLGSLHTEPEPRGSSFLFFFPPLQCSTLSGTFTAQPPSTLHLPVHRAWEPQRSPERNQSLWHEARGKAQKRAKNQEVLRESDPLGRHFPAAQRKESSAPAPLLPAPAMSSTPYRHRFPGEASFLSSWLGCSWGGNVRFKPKAKGYLIHPVYA